MDEDMLEIALQEIAETVVGLCENTTLSKDRITSAVIDRLQLEYMVYPE